MNTIENTAQDVLVINKAKKIINTFANASMSRIVFMSVMGSRCRGAEHENSDWDFMFVYDPQMSNLASRRDNVRFKYGNMEFVGISLDTWLRNLMTHKFQFMEGTFARPIYSVIPLWQLEYTFKDDELLETTVGHLSNCISMVMSAELGLRHFTKAGEPLTVESKSYIEALDKIKYSRVVLKSAVRLATLINDMNNGSNGDIGSCYGKFDLDHAILTGFDTITENILEDHVEMSMRLEGFLIWHSLFKPLRERAIAAQEAKRALASSQTNQFDYEDYLVNPTKYANLVGLETPQAHELGKVRSLILNPAVAPAAFYMEE